MSNKSKLVFGFGCCAVLICFELYVIFGLKTQLDTSQAEVVSLKEELEATEEKLAKRSKMVTKCKDKIDDLESKLEELTAAEEVGDENIVEEVSTESSAVVTMTTPVQEQQQEEATTGGQPAQWKLQEVTRDFLGKYQASGLIMTIQGADAGSTGQDTSNLYTVQIEDSMPGAHGVNFWLGLGERTEDGATLVIRDMKHALNGEVVQENITGTVTFNGAYLKWTNSTENRVVDQFEAMPSY